MKPSRARRRGLLAGLFGVYLGLLARVVLWKLGVPFVGSGEERQVKLVPFVATADAGASAPFEVVANLLLLVPFGLYLGLLAPSTPWWKPTGVVAATSVAFDTLQYVLAVGRADLTDVVANTAGGLLGLGLIGLAHRRLQDETSSVMTWVCATGTLLCLVAVGLVLASPIRYRPRPPEERGRQRDSQIDECHRRRVAAVWAANGNSRLRAAVTTPNPDRLVVPPGDAQSSSGRTTGDDDATRRGPLTPSR